MLTIITFLIVLGILVLFHEFGHFITARIFKVKAEEFGFGYPPRMIGIVKDDNGKWKKVGAKEDASKFKNIVLSLNWLPLGGFVKIKGENEMQVKDADSFGSKKIWQRIIMLFSGVFMNVVLCILIFTIGFNIGVPTAIDEEVMAEARSIKNKKIQIIAVSKDSPAELSGVKLGDEVIKFNTKEIESIEQLQTFVNDNKNKKVSLTVSRLGEEIELQITPQVSEELDGRVAMGVGLTETGLVTYPWYLSIWKGILATYNLLIAMFAVLFALIKSLFTPDKMAMQVGGPVAIAQITGQYAKMGFVYVMQFTALLSLNLAIINILPFPALDGGRILFLIIEKIRGKENNQKVEAIIHNLGFYLLMALIAWVTLKDVLRLF